MINYLQEVFLALLLVASVIMVFNFFDQEINSQTIQRPKSYNRSIPNVTFPVFDGSGIPRLIHYTYMHQLLPVAYRELIRSCLKFNPNVTFIFWSDQDAYELVKKHYPDRLSIYETYIKGEGQKLKKSDLIRPLILYRYGGVYMDLDTRCQKPLAPVLRQDSCIVSSDVDVKLWIMYNMAYLLMNSFMACIPRHRFFGFVIDEMSKNNHGQILHTTGPFALTRQYDAYRFKFISTSEALEDRHFKIALGAWRHFSPYLDKNLIGYCGGFIPSKLSPSNLREQACLLWQRYMDQQKVDVAAGTVVHLFLNLGYSGAKITNSFNITTTFTRIVIAKSII